MLHRLVSVISLWLVAALPVAQDHALVGAWKAVTYEINGVEHPMQGVFIFTKSYYSANVRFKLGNGPIDDANGNAAVYPVDQWILKEDRESRSCRGAPFHVLQLLTDSPEIESACPD